MDSDSDATYCSAVEDSHLIQNKFCDNSRKNIPEKDARVNCIMVNIDDTTNQLSQLQVQNLQRLDDEIVTFNKRSSRNKSSIKKNQFLVEQEISAHAFHSRNKTLNIKQIKERLADIHEEVHGWLTGWGRELQKSQVECILMELKQLNSTLAASTFPNVKELQDIKQMAEKLLYQLHSTLSEMDNEKENSCCCCCVYASAKSACNISTEPSLHKLSISSRDPRLYSSVYKCLLSRTAQTCSCNGNECSANVDPQNPLDLNNIFAHANSKHSQKCHGTSNEQSASMNEISSLDIFDSYCSESSNELKQRSLNQKSKDQLTETKANIHLYNANCNIPNVNTAPRSAENLNSNSTMFTLYETETASDNVNTPHVIMPLITDPEPVPRNAADCECGLSDSVTNSFANMKNPSLAATSKNLTPDIAGNQFQNYNLAETEATLCQDTLATEVGENYTFNKLHSLHGSKLLNSSNITRIQCTLCEEGKTTVQMSQIHDSTNKHLLPSELFKKESFESERRRGEITRDNSTLPNCLNSEMLKKTTNCENHSNTLTNASKEPLSLDMFASYSTTNQARASCTNTYNVLQVDEAEHEKGRSHESSSKYKSVIPFEQMQSKESNAIVSNRGMYNERMVIELPTSNSSTNMFPSSYSYSKENITSCTFSADRSEIKQGLRKVNKKKICQANNETSKLSQKKCHGFSTKQNQNSNMIYTGKTKAKRVAIKTHETEPLSLDLFASNKDAFKFSGNEINGNNSYINKTVTNCSEKMLKSSKKSLNGVHGKHDYVMMHSELNIPKIKDESLLHCIKRLRLPSLSEFVPHSTSVTKFWNESAYPLPQEMIEAVENW